MTDDGPDETPVDIDVFYDALEDRERPVVTATEVARVADCSQAAAVEALETLAAEGRLERLDAAADPVVWFPADYRETAARERLTVFPERHEIVADQPSQFTRARLSQFARLEETNHEGGYRYVVREQDVWSAPAETLEALLTTVRSALGRRYDSLEEWIEGQWERAHKFRLRTHEDGYVVLEATSADLLGNVAERHLDDDLLRARIGDETAWVAADRTAELKRTLYEAGYPVQDRRDLESGDPLSVELDVELRPYQADWVARFADAGSGVLVGPPGSGKTVAALGIMADVEGETLVLVPSRELAGQWRERILADTTLSPEEVGEYHGGTKEVRPVTVATYRTAGMDRHRSLFDSREWGLIVYDECQRIPSPVSRRSASLQTKRRLGLSVEGDTMLPIRQADEISIRPIEEFVSEHLGDSIGISELDGPETLSVTSEGKIEWTDVTAVMRHENAGNMYRIRARNGRQVTVTEDHSLIVFDSDAMSITSKMPRELGDTDYLLQPTTIPADTTKQSIDLRKYIDDGYLLLEERTPESQFDPLYEEKIGGNKDRYKWTSRKSLPIDIADRANIDDEYVRGIYKGKRTQFVKPTVSVEDLARLTGLFVADGCLDDHRVEFYATDTEDDSEVAEFRTLIRKIAPEANVTTVQNGRNCTTVRISGPLVDVFRSFGLSNGAREKSVPKFVLSNPHAYEPFIEGVVLGDGHKQKRERGKEMVTISTSSDQLAQGLNFLLSALGYVGGNYRRNEDFSGRDGDHDIVTNNQIRFNPNNESKTPRNAMVPFSGSIREAYKSLPRMPHEDRPYGADGGTLETGLSHRSRLNTDELDTLLNRSGLDSVDWLRNNDVAMLEVDEVERAGDEEYVYDISTAEENFLGNHLFCHNSATPVRGDDREDEIYTLVGPPIGTDWEALFEAGYVAEPEVELRYLPWDSETAKNEYGAGEGREKRQLAATNPAKIPEIEAILREHPGSKTVVFVEYLDQGDAVAEALGVPFVSGETPHARRSRLFDRFRAGELDTVVVSRVGDEGIDLPDAEVAVAASGLGGSRRQGAQRAGRTMRPAGKARMYVLATRGTREEEFARERTRHLAARGVSVREGESAVFGETAPGDAADRG